MQQTNPTFFYVLKWVLFIFYSSFQVISLHLSLYFFFFSLLLLSCFFAFYVSLRSKWLQVLQSSSNVWLLVMVPLVKPVCSSATPAINSPLWVFLKNLSFSLKFWSRLSSGFLRFSSNLQNFNQFHYLGLLNFSFFLP